MILEVKETPILYSFRRCPYAIRARLALSSANIKVEIREVVLREKPKEFIEVSASKTVPCLVTDKNVIDQSLDIMLWALDQNDPENWLDMPDEGFDVINLIEDKFKPYLDKTKYSSRYPKDDFEENRMIATDILKDLDRVQEGKYFFGNKMTLCDVAVFPFVRQFAFINIDWFNGIQWRNLNDWLNCFLKSEMFVSCQKKFLKWESGNSTVYFP